MEALYGRKGVEFYKTPHSWRNGHDLQAFHRERSNLAKKNPQDIDVVPFLEDSGQ